jgi:hypothetical protein
LLTSLALATGLRTRRRGSHRSEPASGDPT